MKLKIKNFITWKFGNTAKNRRIGGYAAPLNLIKNPFNKYKNFRNVYRSLQYARSNMFIGIRLRYII